MSTPEAPIGGAASPVQRRRGWRTWAARTIAGLCVLVYLFSLAAYAAAGQSKIDVGPPPVSGEASGINFAIDLVAMDPAKGQISLRMFISPQGSFYDDADGSFARSLRLTVRYQTGGQVTRDIPAGTPVGGTTELNIFADGNPNTYPFDHYTYGWPAHDELADAVDPTDVAITAPAPLVSVAELDAKNQPLPTRVPMGVYPSGGLQGWTENWHYAVSEEPIGNAVPGNTMMLLLEVKRGGGVLAFVIVVLTLMAVTAVLAGLVARSVARRRRPIEATMAGWFAALLFALVPLRTNLPGAPPIGAWLDVAIFYWVELALLVAMAIFIGSWLKYRKPPSD